MLSAGPVWSANDMNIWLCPLCSTGGENPQGPGENPQTGIEVCASLKDLEEGNMNSSTYHDCELVIRDVLGS